MDNRSAARVKAFIEDKPKNSNINKLFSLFSNKKVKYKIEPVLIRGEVLRIPIIRKGRIAYEYDTVTDRILNRNEALSRHYEKANNLCV